MNPSESRFFTIGANSEQSKMLMTGMSQLGAQPMTQAKNYQKMMMH